MITDNKSNKENPPQKIHVTFWSETGEVGQTDFNDPNTTFQDVKDYFNKRYYQQPKTLKKKYTLNGKPIQPKDRILDIVHVNKKYDLEVAEFWVELNEYGCLEDNNDEPVYSKILVPKFNPFGLIVLEPLKGTISIEGYPEFIRKKFGLDRIKKANFAFCNSPEALYVSEKKNFWIIFFEKYKIKYKELPKEKENHSMLYVQEGKVYFVGGKDKSTFYYDINDDEFIDSGVLQDLHEKPALIRSGDDICCFNDFPLDSNETFEKNSITRFSGQWEKVEMENKDGENHKRLKNKNFAVCPCDKGNILFVGGNGYSTNVSESKKTFLYDWRKNELIENSKSTDCYYNLLDKKFYRVNDRNCVAIPDNFDKNQYIALVDLMTRSSKLIKFTDMKNLKNKKGGGVNFINSTEEKPGDLAVKATIAKEQELVEGRKSVAEVGRFPRDYEYLSDTLKRSKEEEERKTYMATQYSRISVPYKTKEERETKTEYYGK